MPSMLNYRFTNKQYSSKNILVYSKYASEKLKKPYWLLITDYRVEVSGIKGVSHVFIPKGFLSDGASMPSERLRIFPYWGRYRDAVLVHDYLCEYKTAYNGCQTVDISRRQADVIFLKIMRHDHVPIVTRRAMYTAVCVYRVLSHVCRYRFKGYSAKRAIESKIKSEWDSYIPIKEMLNENARS